MPDQRKITGYKSGKPEVGWWLEQLRWGLQWRQERAFESRWPIWNMYYRGEWKSNILPHNLFFRVLRTIVPRTYFRNPSISVISRRAGIENYVLAQLMEITDNRLIKDMQLKKEMKRMVHSGWMRGTGVSKLGIGSRYEVDPQKDQEAPEGSSGSSMHNRVEYDRRIAPGMPWFRNVHTSQYVVPYGTIVKEDARWDCFIFRRPTADIMSDPRFKSPKDLEPNSMEMFVEGAYNTGVDEDGLVPMSDLYEFRDKKTGKVFVITPSHDKPLIYEDDVYQDLRVDPANYLIFNEDDEGFWGLPDAQIIEPTQKEANDIRTYMMYHRRLSIMKILAKKEAVDPDQIQKLLNGDILSVIWTNDDVKDSLAHIQASTIPQELFQMDNTIEGDVRDMLGQSQNQAGEFKQGSRSPTATEVAEVSEAANIRTDERRDMIADLVTKIVTDINPIIFRNWNEEIIEKVVGPGGLPIWIKFRPSMLERGQYEFRTDPDSSVPETRNLREAKAIKLYEVLKPNPLVNPLELTRYLLHEMHGVAFDSMMRGLPQDAGMSQEQPLNVGQFTQLMQQAGQQGLGPAANQE